MGDSPSTFSGPHKPDSCQVRRDHSGQLQDGSRRYEGYPIPKTAWLPTHQNTAQTSAEAILAIVIAMQIMIMVGIIGRLNFHMLEEEEDGGHLQISLSYSHQKPFFYSILLLGAATYSLTAIGAMLGRFFPTFTRTLDLVALLLAVLAITILQWALLPSSFRWLPCIFFAAAILAAIWRAAPRSPNKVSCGTANGCCYWDPTIHSPTAILGKSSG